LVHVTLEMWQGAEQEFAAGTNPVGLFESLWRHGVFVFRPPDNIPRACLSNGGVCYIHSNLFEVSTPECRDSLELVAYEKACEGFARLASWGFEEETGQKVHLYKTNIASDPKHLEQYTTVGAHENYLVERETYIDNMHKMVPYMVLRQILFGAGGYVGGVYMISPRVIFPKKVYSETSTDYPIISTRDEPHAYEKFFRVHVVNGEGTRSDYTTFLKYSFTSYVLTAIQRGLIDHVPELTNPMEQNRKISSNLEGDWGIDLVDGGKIKVTDYLNAYYLEGVEKVFSELEVHQHDRFALKELKWVLKKLEEGLIEDLASSLEWVIKLSLIERDFKSYFLAEKGLDEASAKRAATFQYSSVTDPLFDSLVEEHIIKTVVSEKEVESAFRNPPEDSRGEFRVAVAKKFGKNLDTLSWSYLKLKKGYSSIPYYFSSLEGWDETSIEIKLTEIAKIIGN
jgi:hypothetical protein